MKTRHIVFMVIALLLTAAALVSASISNSFARGLQAEQGKENDNLEDAIGAAGGAFVFVVFGLFFLIASFVLLVPALIFAIIDIRVPVLWLRIVSAVLLALDVASLVVSVGTVLLLNA